MSLLFTQMQTQPGVTFNCCTSQGHMVLTSLGKLRDLGFSSSSLVGGEEPLLLLSCISYNRLDTVGYCYQPCLFVCSFFVFLYSFSPFMIRLLSTKRSVTLCPSFMFLYICFFSDIYQLKSCIFKSSSIQLMAELFPQNQWHLPFQQP